MGECIIWYFTITCIFSLLKEAYIHFYFSLTLKILQKKKLQTQSWRKDMISLLAFNDMFEVKGYDVPQPCAIDWANQTEEDCTRAPYVITVDPMRTLHVQTRLSAMLWF